MRRWGRPSRARPRAVLAAVWLLVLLLPARPAHAATTWVVTSTADDGTGSCPSATNCQLRKALAAAQNGDTVEFAVSGIIAVTSTLTIGTNIAVLGPGVGTLAVDGQHTVTVFQVNAGVQATLAGPDYPEWLNLGLGGGINNSGTLMVSNSTISGNSSVNGGGIFNNNNGTLTVSNTTISGTRSPAASASGAASSATARRR